MVRCPEIQYQSLKNIVNRCAISTISFYLFLSLSPSLFVRAAHRFDIARFPSSRRMRTRRRRTWRKSRSKSSRSRSRSKSRRKKRDDQNGLQVPRANNESPSSLGQYQSPNTRVCETIINVAFPLLSDYRSIFH